MASIEVLVATMSQKDLSKYNEMNIQTDAVFANQDDRYDYLEEVINGNTVKMITTAQRGLGKNRNIALSHAKADILMLADDDLVYMDGYRENVLNAFSEIKDADIIIFNYDTNSERKPRKNKTIKRVRLWNFTKYGTCRIVIKRKAIMKCNINFALLFGSGSLYNSGEDSLFLRECLKKGLKIYTHPYKTSDVDTRTSTWFKGFDEEYFFNKGAWLAAAFPILKYLGALFFTFKIKKRTDFCYKKIIKLLFLGIKGYEDIVSYKEWKNKSIK